MENGAGAGVAVGIYRYVCPHCLRTFVDSEYSEDQFCWECGQGLQVIPKEENVEWVKSSEKMPKECKLVLGIVKQAFNDLEDYAIIYHDEKDWCDIYGNYFFDREVICWTDLPEKPCI